MKTIEYLGYNFNSNGTVFKNGKEVKYYYRTERDKKYVRVRLNGKRYALATLICELFNGKSKNRNLIFKDQNTLNLDAKNLMFLDNANFKTYSKWYPKNPAHRRINTLCHLKAFMLASDKNLKKFYLTQDIGYVYKCWNKFNRFLKTKKHKDDVFDYFLDRCLRNSILGNPYELMKLYEKTFWHEKYRTFEYEENDSFF